MSRDTVKQRKATPDDAGISRFVRNFRDFLDI